MSFLWFIGRELPFLAEVIKDTEDFIQFQGQESWTEHKQLTFYLNRRPQVNFRFNLYLLTFYKAEPSAPLLGGVLGQQHVHP